MTSHWKAILGIILVFIFGCLFGALATSAFFYHRTAEFLQRGPEGMADLLERRMTRNLGLNEDQQRQIHACFMNNADARRELQVQIQPQIQTLNREMLQQINAILRPDQQERFHENLVRFRQRFGKSPFNPNAENNPVSPPAPPPTNSGGTNPPH
jgi:hypothetical protein